MKGFSFDGPYVMHTEEKVPLALLHHEGITRRSLGLLLQGIPPFNLIFSSADATELKRSVATGRIPTVLVLGLHEALHLSGDLLAWCRKQLPQCRLLVLGPEPHAHVLYSLLAAGVHGFCTPASHHAQLAVALQHILMGALHFPAALHQEVMRHGPAIKGVVVLEQPLTPRQRELLTLLVRAGYTTYPAIAAKMGVSLGRVHKYRNKLFRRLGVTSREELVAVARQLGYG